jgi:hypothetical protein
LNDDIKIVRLQMLVYSLKSNARKQTAGRRRSKGYAEDAEKAKLHFSSLVFFLRNFCVFCVRKFEFEFEFEFLGVPQ